MATKAELHAKSDATRLKNLLARKAQKPLSKGDENLLETLKAKVKRAKTQIAFDVVQQVSGATSAKGSWFTAPASTTWTGRRIRNKKTQKEYVIGDVFGEMHVEIEKDAKTTIHGASSLRLRYDPC